MDKAKWDFVKVPFGLVTLISTFLFKLKTIPQENLFQQVLLYMVTGSRKYRKIDDVQKLRNLLEITKRKIGKKSKKEFLHFFPDLILVLALL